MTAGPDGLGRFCPVCGTVSPRLRPGPGGVRPDASCPSCGSLERHRLVALVLQGLAPLLTGAEVLEVGPATLVSPVVAALGPGGHTRVELDRVADGLPLPDASVDVALAVNVLQTVVDDRALIVELARVLRPGAVGLVMVPWSPSAVTDDHPGRPDPAGQLRSYGGTELESRLGAAGLRTLRFLARDLADPVTVTALGLLPTDAIWVIRRAAGSACPPVPLPPVPLPSGALRQVLLGRVLAAGLDAGTARRESDAEAARLRAEIELLELTMEARVGAFDRRRYRVEKAARDWERRYHHLRGRFPLRVAAMLTAPVRRVRHAHDVSWADIYAADGAHRPTARPADLPPPHET